MYSPMKILIMPERPIRFRNEAGTAVATDEVTVKQDSAPLTDEPASSHRRPGFLGRLFRGLGALLKLAADTSLAVGQPRPGDGVRWWR
jgi:hypothetical protein